MDDVKKLKARKKRLPTLTTSLVLGLICLSGCSTGSDLENGQAALDARDYDSAISHLESVVKKGPKDAEPYLLLATAYTETGDLYSVREANLNRIIQKNRRPLQ